MNDIDNSGRKGLRVGRYLWILGGMLLWIFLGKAIQEVLVWGAFLFAVYRARQEGIAPWRTWQGYLFLGWMVWGLVTLPLGANPRVSVLEAVRELDVLAGVFALSVLLRRPGAVGAAFAVTGSALSLVVLNDWFRLWRELGIAIFEKAHFHEPFFLGHPSNASIAAGIALWMLMVVGIRYVGPRRRWVGVGVFLGVAINLLYIFTLAARGPQVALLGSLFVVPFVMPDRRYALAGLGLVLLLALVGISQRERLNARFGNEVTMSGFNDRTKVWLHTWELCKERPWTGYGWGHRVFEEVYYTSDPPASKFHFPHCHQYWLGRVFAWGFPGGLLTFAAWAGLIWGVYRSVLATKAWRDRVLPTGLLGILALLHIYGMGDMPQGIVPVLMAWSIPCGLVILAGGVGLAGGDPQMPAAGKK